MAANNDNRQLKTGFNEPMKTFLVYTDGLLTEQYEARANAEDGDPCLKTQYEYVVGTTRVEKILESNATWDSDWDI